MRIFKTQDITRLYLFTSDAFNEPFPIFLENSDNRKYRCKLDSSFFLPSLVQTKETPVYIIFSSKSKVQNYRVQNCTDLMGKKNLFRQLFIFWSFQRKESTNSLSESGNKNGLKDCTRKKLRLYQVKLITDFNHCFFLKKWAKPGLFLFIFVIFWI